MTREERINLNIELRKDNKQCCSKCEIVKPLTDYFADTTCSTGYSYTCKECKKEERLKRRETRKKNRIVPKEKECYTCNVVKPINQFKNSVDTIDGKHYECKECSNKKGLEYRKKNPHKTKEWREKNHEYVLQYDRARNKERFQRDKEKIKRRNRKRYKTDPKYRFSELVRGHLQGVTKRNSFKTIWNDIREVYDFYGIKYNIDHKIPQEWFKFNSPKNIINHLDNLQVIDAPYNLSKQNRWSDQVTESYLELALPHIKKKYLKKLLAEQNKFVSLTHH